METKTVTIRLPEDVLKEMETIAGSKYATGAVTQQDVLKAQTETTLLQQQLLKDDDHVLVVGIKHHHTPYVSHATLS